jgi:hypothetical protein
VDGAGTAGRKTDPDFAGELGVGHGHEGRHLFVSNLYEFNLVSPLEGSDHAVDAVARISVDPADTPGMQPFNDEIADFHGEAPLDEAGSVKPCLATIVGRSCSRISGAAGMTFSRKSRGLAKRNARVLSAGDFQNDVMSGGNAVPRRKIETSKA